MGLDAFQGSHDVGVAGAFFRELLHEAAQGPDGLEFLVLGQVLTQADPLRFAVQCRACRFGYEGADDLAGWLERREWGAGCQRVVGVEALARARGGDPPR